MLAGGVLVSVPVIAACSSGPTYDQWAATDGAAGRINLDAVQDAYKESKSATEFEKRVNRIYEGDGVVLIRASQDGERQMVEAFEDLNGDGQIDDSADDLLFSITENNRQNEIRGHGANGYYHHGFGGGSFLFGYMVASAFGPSYYYHTPRGTVGGIRTDRANYRKSSVLPLAGVPQQQLLLAAEDGRRVPLHQREPQSQQLPAVLPVLQKVHRSIQDQRHRRPQ